LDTKKGDRAPEQAFVDAEKEQGNVKQAIVETVWMALGLVMGMVGLAGIRLTRARRFVRGLVPLPVRGHLSDAPRPRWQR
jgi:hypothetical protein